MKSRQGVTFIELLITISIFIILAIVVVLNLQGAKNATDLTDTTKQITALLREAQSDSVAQEQGSVWGVYFSNATNTAPFYALFAGPATGGVVPYSTSTLQGNHYPLPATVGYANTFLPSGAITSITFAGISGVASVSTTIQLYLLAQPSLSSAITVAAGGAIGD